MQELGGLEVTLGTINVLVAKQTTEALQSQWAKAGIKTKIESYDLAGLIKAFGGKWESMLQTAGAWDPATGVGVSFRFSSQSPFTGVKDPALDKLLGDAASSLELMTLGAGLDAEIVVSATGADADAALRAVGALVADGFGET